MSETPQRKSRKQELIPGVMTWQLLERILNNYHLWHEIYSRTLETDLTLNGMTINIHDILKGIDELPPRQREAVVLSCLEGRKEVDVARIMGFTKWSSQVGMYKRKALKTLCDNIWNIEGQNG